MREKHLFAGEDYFLSILGYITPVIGFSHHPKQTFPLILNFGATELALPVGARLPLSRRSVIWLASGFYNGRNIRLLALYPSWSLLKPSDSEAALLALRLLHEQGHGELLQTGGKPLAARTDVWPAEQLLKLGPIEIYRHVFQSS